MTGGPSVPQKSLWSTSAADGFLLRLADGRGELGEAQGGRPAACKNDQAAELTL